MKSKYEPLTEYLSQQSDGVVTLSFREIERMIGDELPPSALQYRQWWENQTDSSTRSQCKAWQKAGFRVKAISPKPSGWVQFTRGVA